MASPGDVDVAHMPLKDIPAKHGGDAQESSGDVQTRWEMPKFGTFQKHYYILGLAHSTVPCQSITGTWLQLRPRACHCSQPHYQRDGRKAAGMLLLHRGDGPRGLTDKSRCECRNVTDKHQAQSLLEKGKYWGRKSNTTVFVNNPLAKVGKEKVRHEFVERNQNISVTILAKGWGCKNVLIKSCPNGLFAQKRRRRKGLCSCCCLGQYWGQPLSSKSRNLGTL